MNYRIIHWSLYYRLFFLILISLIGIDLFSKYLCYDLEWGKQFVLIEPTINMGISFSLQVSYALVIPLSLLALGAFWYLFYKKQLSYIVTLLLMAGTIGNFFDRVMYGWVRDFFVMPSMFIFNIADIYLTIWIGLAILSLLQDMIITKKS